MEPLESKNTDLVSRITDSLLFKLGIIGFLTILLLIPAEGVRTLIQERQNRQLEVVREISDKWSGSQLLQGPVMILPYRAMVQDEDASGKSSYQEQITNIYILPEALDIVGNTKPEVLTRGIFEAVVYNAKIQVKGKFSKLELQRSGIDPEKILWDKVRVDIGLSDLKGLKNNPVVTLAQQQYEVEPDFTSLKLFENNLIMQADLSKDRNTALPFNFDLDLRGSSALNFLHLGKTTSVRLEGDWANPSFMGRYLPDERVVTADKFSANWKIPFFNRPYPQQWIEKNTSLNVSIDEAAIESSEPATVAKTTNDGSSFGVKFLLGVDQYQKTMRTAKYSFLIILLSFISLFFTELLQKRKVHILQYVLIGAAMTIYYTLLLAFSEKIGFNLAYFIASFATVLLISSFIGTILKNRKPAVIFGSILSVFYAFIFVIIQLQDLALLVGSIGLFVIIAILMFLSTRIDWNRREAIG